MRAAEMALIRLCYAADLPSPSDAIKALQNGAGTGASGGAPAPAPRGGGGGGGAAARLATSQPATAVVAQAAPVASAPAPRTFTEVVALFETRREARLVHHLMHHVHEVRCEPGVIEFRPERDAPSDLAAKLSGFLSQWTGRRWLVSVVREEGKPTLSQQKTANADSLRAQAESNPTVQAILKIFPGAKLEAVRRKGEEASMLAGLTGGAPADEEPPPAEEYPADDDIPESEY
jgi:DNA polymerase-3 subunit gamma/tau